MLSPRLRSTPTGRNANSYQLQEKIQPAYLETHVIRQEGKEVVLHVAADERVSEDQVQQRVAGQIQNPVGHLEYPLGPLLGREHGKADVLEGPGEEHCQTLWAGL